MEWRAWRTLRNGFSGVVHVLWGERDLGVLDLLMRRSNSPLCCTFHSCSDNLAQVIGFPRRLKRLDAVVLVSETQRSVAEDLGVHPSRIHVIKHGVDTCYFRPSLERNATTFTVLTVGSYRRKFHVVREVCRHLDSDPNIRVVVVAPEAFRQTFDGLKNVVFLTRLSDEQLRHAYQSASCLLMTAENATANNAVLEAMACGLPIISENVGGIPEYVDDHCAQLTAPDQPKELAAAIRDLSALPARVAEMGKAVRARAESLDWTLVADRYAELYRLLVAETRPR